ncbi:aminoacyl-tRNA hydrolase [Patescibacteria group bacterium]|nr:MAG: aminoacyl-tRNA hydrolase [Patescibacteria group bacterium]
MARMFIVVGLGNPGVQYEGTRHNTGRLVVGAFLKMFAFPESLFQKKYQALAAEGKVGREKVLVLFPETFMNKSGASVSTIVTSKKKAESLVVVHDDLDLPLGKIKISFNRGNAGHRGVASIVRAIKTEAFVRIRVGISPATPSGKLKKPQGDREVERHILGEFKPSELEMLKKVSKKVAQALETIVLEGREGAMNKFN